MSADTTTGRATAKTATIERRGFLKAFSVGAVAAGAGVSADAALAPAAASENRNDRTKARYRASSAHVQAFYRTNRY